MLSLFCYALLCVHSSFAIILKRKRKLGALLLLSYRCIVIINVLWLFLKVPWIGLQQCSAKKFQKLGTMSHHLRKSGDISKNSGT